MTRSLYGWKPPPPTTPTDYLKQQEMREAAARAAVAADRRLQQSRDWLADYHSRPRQTQFIWNGQSRPMMTTQEQADVEEAYRQTAQAAQERDETSMGDAAGEAERVERFCGSQDLRQDETGPILDDGDRSGGRVGSEPSFTDPPF